MVYIITKHFRLNLQIIIQLFNRLRIIMNYMKYITRIDI